MNTTIACAMPPYVDLKNHETVNAVAKYCDKYPNRSDIIEARLKKASKGNNANADDIGSVTVSKTDGPAPASKMDIDATAVVSDV